jgi:hypothetical protein
MKRNFQYLISTIAVTLILLLTNIATVHSNELQITDSLISLNPSCCEHGCQASLMEEEDADDAEDEEMDDKDTSSMDYDSIKAE